MQVIRTFEGEDLDKLSAGSIVTIGNFDGVHLGQDDMNISQARQLLGRDKIIGISTHSVDQALKAEAHGADYIAIGSIFPTSSKEAPQVVGLDTLRKVIPDLRPAAIVSSIHDTENSPPAE